MTELLKRIYERAALCRTFEEECAHQVQAKNVTVPVYLSTGQEYIPATIATWMEDNVWTEEQKGNGRQIFIQHRGHSQYLCFGGNLDALVLELLGDPKGCAWSMGGSASIQSKEANIYGHDGLMGTQVPIAVGMCFANRKPTLCFMGDAAAEEDYVLASLGWAATQHLPILFVVEDNGLSILTKKQVRRSWEIEDVASGFGVAAGRCSDDPGVLYSSIPFLANWPALLNVHTKRLRWHAGAGTDDPNTFDRHTEVVKYLPRDYTAKVTQDNETLVRKAWQRHCAK